MEETRLVEQDILALLDAETGGEWPIFRAREPRLAYHALRLLVFRKPKGGGYAIVFETLVGADEEKFCILCSIISPEAVVLAEGYSREELYLETAWDAQGENVIVGPAGEVTVSAHELRELEPQRATVGTQEEMLFTLLVRAYLAAEPDAFWLSEDILRSRLASDFDFSGYELLLESTAFEHVVGMSWNDGDPEGIDSPWRKLPSESPVYQSLARAIVEGDASLFAPGVSNLDWRLHLDAPRAERQLDTSALRSNP